MSLRSWFAAAMLAALLASLSASAHGGAYDPLVVDVHAFLAADGTLARVAPAPGAVPFPAPAPPASAPALRFVLDAPVRFAPGGPFTIALTVRADEPVVARDVDGNAFEVNVEPGGTPVRVALGTPILAPGSVASASASVQAASALYAEGDELAVTIRPLMPLTDGALSLMVGGDAPSTFDAPDMRVPMPADLRLQDVPHTEFLLEGESFEPPATHAVNVFLVGHDGITPPSIGAWSANGTYVVLRGEEPDDSAAAHEHADRDARIAAAHELRVNGIPARVHPGLGVVVRASSLPLIVDCARNCPAGFSWSYAPPTGATPTEAPSALVVPPRDTSGIPVSKDAPADERVPLSPVVPLVALAIVALALRHRR